MEKFIYFSHYNNTREKFKRKKLKVVGRVAPLHISKLLMKN